MPREQPKIGDGGPAFPVVETHPVHGSRIDFGMSLRDYFAGQALAGLAVQSYASAVFLAESAYRIADEMLKARQQ